MTTIAVPVLPTGLWLISTAGGISLVMVCFFLYVYMRRRFIAAQGDMRDVADLAALRVQLDAEKTALEERISFHKNELLSVQAEREEQEKFRADLARLQTECAVIEQQMMELRTENGELESNRHTLVQTNERLNSEKEVLKTRIKELETQQSRLTDLQAQIEEAEKDLAAVQRDWDALQKQITDAKGRIPELRLELDSLQRQCSSLDAQRQSLEETINRKGEEAKDAQQHAQENINKLNVTEKELHEKQMAVRQLEERYNEQEAGIRRLEAHRAVLEQVISQKTIEAKGTQERLEDSAKELMAANKELQEKQSTVQRLEERYNDLATGVKRLEAQRAALEQECQQLKGTLTGEPPEGTDEQYDDLLKNAPACLDIKVFKPKRLNLRSEEEAVDNVIDGLGKIGYRFNERVVKAFHTSLKCHDINPLTVLAGVSGTGKTLLPMVYSRLMGMYSLVMAVQPRWDSPQDMFGFYNYLEKRYKATDLARSLIRMDPYNTPEELNPKEKRADRMLLVLMDEMNLARTEYYFSEFLSKLELRRDIDDCSVREKRVHAEVVLDTGPGRDDLRIWVGQNVLFVGTMNEDESTQTLSDKVLDRANVLRFARPKDISLPKGNVETLTAEGYLAVEQWESWCRSVETRAWTEKVAQWISRLNDALNRIGRPFGYRVQKSMLTYVQNYPGIDGHEVYKRAFADQIEQKVLPKLRGIEVLEGNGNTALEEIEDIIAQTEDELLFNAFKNAKDEAATDMFIWRGVTR